jgi:CAF1 family ribonuclease
MVFFAPSHLCLHPDAVSLVLVSGWHPVLLCSTQLLVSSRAFIINQFGLSAFSYEGGGYRARTFNFYLFPRRFQEVDRCFMCQVECLCGLLSVCLSWALLHVACPD